MPGKTRKVELCVLQMRREKRKKRSAAMMSDYEDDDDEEDDYVPPPGVGKAATEEASQDDDDDDLPMDSDSDDMFNTSSSKKEKSRKPTFANALLKIGTKSTKDSTLDKPIQRRPGRLLETAGRSLMQRSVGSTTSSSYHSSFSSSSLASNNAFNALASSTFGSGSSGGSTKLSFSLYGGHLPVDHGGYTKSGSSDAENDGGSSRNRADPHNPAAIIGSESNSERNDSGGSAMSSSAMSSTSSNAPAKKVFSNWGGEFFKKNLDYRANTNKLLEKMNITVKDRPLNGGESDASSSVASSSSSIPLSSTTPMTSFIPGERFKSLLGGTGVGSNKRPLEVPSPSKDPKKFKPFTFS